MHIFRKKVLTEDQAVAEIFNKFFVNIAPNLKISTDHDYDNAFLPLLTKLQTLAISSGMI